MIGDTYEYTIGSHQKLTQYRTLKRWLKLNRSWSRADLAEAFKCGTNTIRNYEDGITPLDFFNKGQDLIKILNSSYPHPKKGISIPDIVVDAKEELIFETICRFEAGQRHRNKQHSEPQAHDRCPCIGQLALRLAMLDHVTSPISKTKTPLLLLAGAADTGKSRMLFEAKNMAHDRDIRVIAGRCTNRIPYPFIEILREYCKVLGEAQKKQVLWKCRWLQSLLDGEVSIAEPPSLIAGDRRKTIVQEYAQFLVNIAGAKGTLLLLDDLHLADADSRRFLADLAREIQGTTIRIIATFRPEKNWLAMLHSELTQERVTYDLREILPLSNSESSEMVRYLAQNKAITPEQFQQILQVSGGLPGRLSANLEAVLKGERPDTRTHFTQAWKTLSSEARSLLKIVVLYETGIDPKTEADPEIGTDPEIGIDRNVLVSLGKKLGLSIASIIDSLDLLCHKALLSQNEESYQVVEADYRQLVEHHITLGWKKVVHRLIAHVLSKHSPGMHEREHEHIMDWYLHSDRPGKALPFLLPTAQKKEISGRYQAAEALYRTMLQLAQAEGLQDQVVVAKMALARSLRFQWRKDPQTGKFDFSQGDEAMGYLTDALAAYTRLNDLGGKMRALREIAALTLHEGNPMRTKQAQTLLKGAVETFVASVDQHLSDPNPHLHILAPVELALIHLYKKSHQMAEAIATAEEAAAFARLVDDTQICAMLKFRRNIYLPGEHNHFQETKAILEQRIEGYKEQRNLKMLLLSYSALGETVFYRGKFQQAIAYQQEALRIAEHLGDTRACAALYTLWGNYLYWDANWPEALEMFDKAESCLGDRHPSHLLGLLISTRSAIALFKGDFATATELDKDSLFHALNVNDLGMQIENTWRAAEYHLLANTPQAAIDLIVTLRKKLDASSDLSFLLTQHARAILAGPSISLEEHIEQAHQLLNTTESHVKNSNFFARLEYPRTRAELNLARAMLAKRQDQDNLAQEYLLSAKAELDVVLKACCALPYHLGELRFRILFARVLEQLGEILEARIEIGKARQKISAGLEAKAYLRPIEDIEASLKARSVEMKGPDTNGSPCDMFEVNYWELWQRSNGDEHWPTHLPEIHWPHCGISWAACIGGASQKWTGPSCLAGR